MPAPGKLPRPSWLPAEPGWVLLQSCLPSSTGHSGQQKVGHRVLETASVLGTQGRSSMKAKGSEDSVARGQELWLALKSCSHGQDHRRALAAQSQASLPSTSWLPLGSSRALYQPCRHHLSDGTGAPACSSSLPPPLPQALLD